jgi:aspartate aminotransferase
VDAVAPEAAIYLTVKFDLVGKKAPDGELLLTQADVTSYLLQYAKLAIVPFYAFGAPKNSPWYRLSVGTCKREDIGAMLAQLGKALEELH